MEFSVKGGLCFKTKKTTLLPAKKKLETILIDMDTAIQLLLERLAVWFAF